MSELRSSRKRFSEKRAIMVWEAAINGLMQVLYWKSIGFMLMGIFIGFWVGLLPGIGGGVTLSLMLAFIYPMSPVEAFSFLLGMHAVCATTGDLTSILIGVPGEAASAAVILDGYPMTKRGEAGRAMGAALMSSLIGAIFGAFILALSIPIVRPLVLAFGAPELFMFSLLGISCISSLGGQDYRTQIRGFAGGCLGLVLSGVGMDPFQGLPRYSFGTTYLIDNIDIVPVLVGLFAIPEIVDLAVRRTTIAYMSSGKLGKGVWDGIMDTFRHWGLVLRCSAIGAFVGILPGVGGAVSQWIAYAHTVQSARTPEERAGFGKGDVRGVLGPGACNNSKEGGNLIPTISFGVPATVGMAILLAAFMIKGLVPGRDMLTKHLDITFSMVWILIMSNVLTVIACLAFVNHLAKATTVRVTRIIPPVLFMVFIGSYAASNNLLNLVVTIIFGTLGYFMTRFGWPRAPLILGFILGKLVEVYLQISLSRYGYSWISRPAVIITFLLILIVFLYPYLRMHLEARKLSKSGRSDAK
jgi:putative tricarboxylic transport membrane protein